MSISTVYDRVRAEGNRFMARLSLPGNGRVRPGISGATFADRLRYSESLLRDAMLDGTVYLSTASGGQLPTVYRLLGQDPDTAKPIYPFFDAVPSIVSCYVQNAIPGRYGQGTEAAEKWEGRTVPPATLDAIRRVWRWSNLDSAKERMAQLAANQGTVGIRVVSDSVPTPRVYLQFDHPSQIADVQEDSRGNVTAVLLRYEALASVNLGDAPASIKVEELITKERHSLKYDGVEQLDDAQQVNLLGVCPYVILRHDRPIEAGSLFGRHAYAGSERLIHAVNWGLSQLPEAVRKTVRETWFFTGAGNAPTEIPMTDLKAIYVKSGAGIPAATAEAIVPQINLADALAVSVQSIGLLRERQPELVVNAISLLSGISGETLAQILKPAEGAILRARSVYEDALTRAIQIAMSYGVLGSLWDLGTGTGNADAANRAYDDGQGPEAFEFKTRPALPLTTFRQVEQAKADAAEELNRLEMMAKADGLVDRETLLVKYGGWTKVQARKILKAQADEASLEPPVDGVEQDQEIE